MKRIMWSVLLACLATACSKGSDEAPASSSAPRFKPKSPSAEQVDDKVEAPARAAKGQAEGVVPGLTDDGVEPPSEPIDWSKVTHQVDWADFEANPRKALSVDDELAALKAALAECTYEVDKQGLRMNGCEAYTRYNRVREARQQQNVQAYLKERDAMHRSLLKGERAIERAFGALMPTSPLNQVQPYPSYYEQAKAEKDPLVLTAFAVGMRQTRFADAHNVSWLLSQLNHEDSWLRYHALNSLKALQQTQDFLTPEALSNMSGFLKRESDTKVRLSVCQLVQQWSSDASVAVLKEHLSGGRLAELEEGPQCFNMLTGMWWRMNMRDFTPLKSAWEATLELLPSLASSKNRSAGQAVMALPKLTDAEAAFQKAGITWFSAEALAKPLADLVRNESAELNLRQNASQALAKLKQSELLDRLAQEVSNPQMQQVLKLDSQTSKSY